MTLEQLEQRSKHIAKLQAMLTEEQKQLFVLINIEKEKLLGQIQLDLEA